MTLYDHEHSSPWNKLLHGIGIPVIFAGIILAVLTMWRLGAVLFVAGWLMLFLGHRIEGNKPAFFQGPGDFLVGPLCVAKEFWTEAPRPSPPVTAPHHPTIAPPPTITF